MWENNLFLTPTHISWNYFHISILLASWKLRAWERSLKKDSILAINIKINNHYQPRACTHTAHIYLLHVWPLKWHLRLSLTGYARIKNKSGFQKTYFHGWSKMSFNESTRSENPSVSNNNKKCKWSETDIAHKSKFKRACDVASFSRSWVNMLQLRGLIKAACDNEKRRQKAKFRTYSTGDKEIRQQ